MFGMDTSLVLGMILGSLPIILIYLVPLLIIIGILFQINYRLFKILKKIAQ